MASIIHNLYGFLTTFKALTLGPRTLSLPLRSDQKERKHKRQRHSKPSDRLSEGDEAADDAHDSEMRDVEPHSSKRQKHPKTRCACLFPLPLMRHLFGYLCYERWQIEHRRCC